MQTNIMVEPDVIEKSRKGGRGVSQQQLMGVAAANGVWY